MMYKRGKNVYTEMYTVIPKENWFGKSGGKGGGGGEGGGKNARVSEGR